VLIEQSMKNTGVHWNTICNKLIGHINIVARFIVLPWIVLFFIVIAILAYDLFAGKLGHNGGMTGLFQSIGLHPHATYMAFLFITGIGVFFAIVWILWNVSITLLEIVSYLMQKSGLKEWIIRKTVTLQHKFGLITVIPMLFAFMGIIFTSFLTPSPTPRSLMAVRPPDGLQGIKSSPYSSVLLRVPNSPHPNMPTSVTPATHTISGKAVVTQIGPHTYQVRMVS